MQINVDELSLEEKIGQMIIVGMNSTYITERTRNLILNHKIGGIILYRKNFKTYEDLLNLIKELKNINSVNKVPLFISIDQEGGRVNRMPREILNLPAANKIAKTKNIDLVRAAAKITGEILIKSGFNMNFSPVLDIKRFQDDHAIGDRSYGETKEDVIEYGIPVMEELQNKNIISVIKHFPGHGATKKDSHFGLPKINISIKELEQNDMQVFSEAIERGADAVLVGHLKAKRLTGMNPASLSRKFIIRVLRRKYKFRGLVISDDLKMRAIRLIYGPKTAVRKAFEAKNDIIIFRFNEKQETASINEIINLTKRNKIKEYRINKSVQRILEIKQKYNISDTSEIEGINIEKINSEISNLVHLVSDPKWPKIKLGKSLKNC